MYNFEMFVRIMNIKKNLMLLKIDFLLVKG